MQSTNRTRNITVYVNDQANFVASHDLLGSDSRLRIRHNRENYVLRLTRSGKLILTK